MQQLIALFCDVLTAERDIHVSLLAHSKQKKDAITKNDLPALDKIVKSEEVLLSQLNHWERKRKEYVAELAAGLGRPAQELLLQDFLSLCDEPNQAQLKELHHELKRLLEEQMEINELNKKLIESRLEYINYTLETVSSNTQGASHIYGGGAQPGHSGRKSSIIDQKV